MIITPNKDRPNKDCLSVMRDEQNRDIQLQHDRDPRSNSVFIHFDFTPSLEKKLIINILYFRTN